MKTLKQYISERHEVEQIDELKTSTLQNYQIKASDSYKKAAVRARNAHLVADPDSPEEQKQASKEVQKQKQIMTKRKAGYMKAGSAIKARGEKSVMAEETEQIDEVAAWQRKEGKSESGGLNRKGIESYRRENPGSKLSMAVTTKPSKLKPGSKAANRRKSFCARMGGMKRRLTSAKTARDPDSRINKALRKWNC